VPNSRWRKSSRPSYIDPDGEINVEKLMKTPHSELMRESATANVLPSITFPRAKSGEKYLPPTAHGVHIVKKKKKR